MSEAVIEGIKGLIEAALPGVTVERNADDPERVPDAGWVVVRDGDPGEPEVTLSPRTWIYTHAVRVEVAAPGLTAAARAAKMTALLTPIGLAVQADPTLGGRCDWVEPTMPDRNDAVMEGARPTLWATFDLMATYGTTTPLT